MSSDPWQRWLGPLLSADDGADAEWMSQFTLTALGQASRWRGLPPVRAALEATAKAMQRHDPVFAMADGVNHTLDLVAFPFAQAYAIGAIFLKKRIGCLRCCRGVTAR